MRLLCQFRTIRSRFRSASVPARPHLRPRSGVRNTVLHADLVAISIGCGLASSADRRRRRWVRRQPSEETKVTRGADAPALDQHGYLKTHGYIWVDMERAAANRTEQISSL
jgi:hypothetical protein